MSRDWNGLSLQTEFSTILGDTSTSFKSKVLGWMNDTILDICGSHDWGFLREKGKKILTASAEEHDLLPSTPGASSVAVASGGSLTVDTAYKVAITFICGVSGFETVAGTESSADTTSSGNLTLNVTDIPVSADPLVTARKVYLILGSGEPLYYSTISDNTTTTATITADVSSTIEAPDYDLIKKIDGNPFFESSSQMAYKPLDQLRALFEGSWSSGTPSYWSDMSESQIIMYPTPSSALTLSFYYFKLPPRIYAEKTSTPGVPAWLKPALKAGVLALGYEYRDRDGQQTKRSNYEVILANIISEQGRPFRTATRVRDVMGNADGFEV